MTAARPDNEAIFHAARAIPDPEQRRDYVRQACGGDQARIAHVEALLAAADGPDSLLDRPAAATPLATTDRPAPEGPGTLIGPYKLLEPIGEGGMGSVWMAQQHEPVKRLVAVKLIKAGMDSAQVIARFEAERQALALMDHAHIARVLDGGTTGGGRPYFVMDLVKGVPITRYCDEHRLTPRQRLELFLPVCRAIQHAHQKGIIHRDLKPANVLVALSDGQPVPKVIDFGVAKAAGQQLTDKTLVTGFGALVGTLEYMSPEQAEVNQLDIDTRSDIYSLGVLLYELLTGSPPFTRKDSEKAGLLEMLRVIREQEPTKPSAKLSTAEGLPTLAANRGTEPAQLTRLVRGELDWIVMKALEKDRNRRYETANGFALDVQRYLADEPVLACPPSAGYRLRKFARRNKGGLAVAALVLFFLVLLGSGVGWAVRDQSARQAKVAGQVEPIFAEVDRLEKEQKWPAALEAARRAEAAVAGGEADPATAEWVHQRLRDLNFIDRLEQIRTTQVEEWFDSAQRDRDYARAFREYGVDVDELPVETSIDRLKARPALAVALAAALDDWVDVRRRPPKTDAARWKRLVAVARGIDPESLRDRVRAAWGQPVAKVRDDLRWLADSINVRAQHPATLVILGRTLQRTQQPESALRILRDAQHAHPGDFWLNFQLGHVLAEQKDHAGAVRFYTAAVGIHPSSSGAHNNLGIALADQKKLDEAIVCYRKAIELNPKLTHPHNNLGNALKDKGKVDEAIAEYRKAISLDPEYALAHNNLGSALKDKGKVDEAIACCRLAIALDPKYAMAHYNLGVALAGKGKVEEAIACYHKAIAHDPEFALAHNNLGAALYGKGKVDEAIECFRKAIAHDPKYALAHNNLGNALRDKGKVEEALACYHKAIALGPKFALAHYNLGNALAGKGQMDEAIACYRKAIALDPEFALAHNNLGNALAAQNKLDEAIASFSKAIEIDPKLLEPNLGSPRLARGEALCRTGRFREALADFDKATELGPGNFTCWHHAAALYLYFGEVERYRRACREMLDRFERRAADNVGIAEQMAKTCALAPDAVSDFARVERLAQRAVTGTEKKGWYRNYILAKGLTDYRGGHPEQAAKWLKRFAPKPGGNVWDATAFAALALAQHRLGHAAQARAALVSARALLAKKPDAQLFDWLHCEILYREAEKLMGPVTPKELAAALKQRQLAEAREAVRLKPDSADALNYLAWLLATCSDAKLRQPQQAVTLARKAVELDPKQGNWWNTLGVAHYRAGDTKAAIAALHKSMELRQGGDGNDWFFLAMAHWQLGEKEKARELYDRAVEWLEKNQPKNEELRRFRAEASQVLELKVKK
jgi:tetratricopeptide (TPR) repeat protein/serine/threonine protein kinase